MVWAVDRTVTAAGGRLLERRIAAPSTRVDVIEGRLAAVSWAVEAAASADGVRDILRRAGDIDRALSRLSLDRGGPRDLVAIRSGLHTAAQLASLPDVASVPLDLSALMANEALLDRLDRALVAEPPSALRDGGTIAPGFDPELDETRRLRDEGRGVIAGLQATYAGESGVSSLKIKHNNVLGYFVETTATHEATMRARSDLFIHRQTTANQLRWTTVDLSELETRILNAGSRAQEIEARLFADLRAAVLEAADGLGRTAIALAELDVACAWADLARQADWCRPKVDNSRAFAIEDGRHPVVERALAASGHPFVANDVDLSARNGAAAIRLLTGPNMAGKSTWLRQAALIAVLAQAGAYVPAVSAHMSASSGRSSVVSALPTIWLGGGRPSWSRWSRRLRS